METKREVFNEAIAHLVKAYMTNSKAWLERYQNSKAWLERYDNAVDDEQSKTDTAEPKIHEMALRLMASGRSDIYTVEDAYEFALNLYAEGKDFDDWAKDNLDAFVEHYKQKCLRRYELRRQK